MRKVLAHPVDGEAEIELVGDHRLAAVVHLPRLRRALADDVEHREDVEPGFLGESGCLPTTPATMPAMQIWLTIFVSWPLPGPPSSVTARA